MVFNRQERIQTNLYMQTEGGCVTLPYLDEIGRSLTTRRVQQTLLPQGSQQRKFVLKRSTRFCCFHIKNLCRRATKQRKSSTQ